MITLLKIDTKRLLLSPLSFGDEAFIFDLLNTEGWIKNIGNRNIGTMEDAHAYIKKINSNENITYFTVKIKETNCPIGLVTLIKRDYLEHKDIGFAFLPKYANNGYAYESSSALLHHLIKQKSIHNIMAVTIPENVGSIKLIERLGMVFEKNIEIDNEKLNLYKASINQIVFFETDTQN